MLISPHQKHNTTHTKKKSKKNRKNLLSDVHHQGKAKKKGFGPTNPRLGIIVCDHSPQLHQRGKKGRGGGNMNSPAALLLEKEEEERDLVSHLLVQFLLLSFLQRNSF